MGGKLGLIFTAMAALALPGTASAQDTWPERPINLFVGFGAGGSTDLVARALSDPMAEELGTRITVNNLPGGSGSIAYQRVYESAHNGYSIAAFPSSIGTMAVLGAHPTTAFNEWQPWVAAVFDGVLSVPADSPYETFEDLVEDVQADPDSITLAASNAGSVWHRQYALLSDIADVQFRFVSYPGSQPSQVAAVSGDVDVVLTGLGEQRDLIRSGQLRPLAAFRSESAEVGDSGEIPAITEFVPELEERLPLASYIGIMVPQDTPSEVMDRIEEAFLAAVETEDFRSVVEDQLFGTVLGYDAEDSLEYVQNQTSLAAWTLDNLGLTENSPEEFDIPRP